MVTRRQFGYALRERIAATDPDLKVELSFSESLLETWTVREAFLFFFCLLVDPDAPTWRAWLGYQNSFTGKAYKAAQRNADAYLKLLADSHDDITDSVIEEIARNDKKPPGGGGKNLWERAKRFIDLRTALSENGEDAHAFITEIFDADLWVTSETADTETAQLNMRLCFDKAISMLDEIKEAKPKWKALQHLAEVARRLRYQIATREPFEPDETASLQVATLWGAKGVTADHVYVRFLLKPFRGREGKSIPALTLNTRTSSAGSSTSRLPAPRKRWSCPEREKSTAARRSDWVWRSHRASVG